MGNIIKFHSSYSFCADVLKIKDENGNVKQKVYIGIKDKERKKVIINPVTSLLRTWSSKKLPESVKLNASQSTKSLYF